MQVFPVARFSDLKAASDTMRVIADGWYMILPEVGGPGSPPRGAQEGWVRAASSAGQCLLCCLPPHSSRYPYCLPPH